jgi:dTDP-L-rhamnose 4-epimerase
MASKKALITGGAGFIGSKLVNYLYKKGYDITVLDILSPKIHGKDPDESTLYKSIINKCKFIKGDVSVKTDWLKSIEDNDIIIHLAAETGTGQSMYEIEQYTQINALSTSILLDILVNKKHQVKKIVLSSTRALYGEGKYYCIDHGIVYPQSRLITEMQQGDFDCKCPICNQKVGILPTDEKSVINPTSVYGITKHFQEELIMKVCESIGIPAVSLRFQNVYGPGQSLSNPYTGILSIFSKLLLKGHDVHIFEDGLESRDFIYIDDIIELIYLSIINSKANFEIFNGGTGKMTTVKEVADALNKKYNSNSKIKITGAFRVGDIRHNYADVKKSFEILNFQPKVSFEDGIHRFCNWVKEQEIVDSTVGYNDSINEMRKKGLYYE